MLGARKPADCPGLARRYIVAVCGALALPAFACGKEATVSSVATAKVKAPYLNYTRLSDVAPNRIAIARLYATKPPKKWDIFTSLRGWQLKSTVRLSGKKGDTVAVTFLGWASTGEDFYDFDKNEHLTLPNPDFQSKASDAILPKEREITVYHTNAFRLEAVGLAKAFMVRVGQWTVSDPKLLSPIENDPKKKLV